MDVAEAHKESRSPSPFTERLQTYVTPEIGDRLRGHAALSRTSYARLVNEALERMLPSKSQLAARMQEDASGSEAVA
jgi:hypothetical protein